MKLKGKNVKKLKDKQKKKMKDTLKRMDKTRDKDNINLRAQINKKMETLVNEKEKATTYIENFKKKIIELEGVTQRIDGALLTLKELIADDTNV